MKAAAIASLFSLLITPLIVGATPVYRWTDESGNVHYSSNKPTANAKPADLPEINRGEVKMPQLKFTSCASHGGIDCLAGPDVDGSVICQDSFRDVTAVYDFNCKTAKLAIADISEPDETGAITVFVRNSKSVEARSIVLSYKLGRGAPLEFSGPAKIDPFGIGEVVVRSSTENVLELPLERSSLSISCENCQ